MTKLQIARKLIDTEAAIKLTKKRLKHLLQKAITLEAEFEKPEEPSVQHPAAIVPKILRNVA